MKIRPPATPGTAVFLRNVSLKALILLVMVNLLFVAIYPLERLGQLSAYNWLYPGRERLPYGERPDLAYNLSLDNLPAMFASHEIHGTDPNSGEFKVVLIGDSSVWGYLLTPAQTLSAQMNQPNLRLANGQQVKVYNLGYPTISLTKDLLFLSQSLHYQPDLIIWLTTLEAFPLNKQLSSPIVQNNTPLVREMIQELDLPLDEHDSSLRADTIWSRTIVGQRRALADLLRLQIYGILWAATGVDQYYPQSYEPPQHDLDPDEKFHDLGPEKLNQEDLAIGVLEAGIKLAGNVPVLVVNEPIYISDGENSHIRYNFFYPRWAYDQYRQILSETCLKHGWNCLDVWDLIPAPEFTNSAIHLSPHGTAILADSILSKIKEIEEKLVVVK